MLHRESGVFKTTYAADMALYPLPIARWTVAALGGAVRGDRAADAARILPVDPQPDLHRHRRRARAQHPGRLHRPDLDRPRRLHVGRRLHRGQPRRAARPAVLAHPAGGRADGGADRRHRRHPEPAHQGPLSRHRHAGRPAHHRMDHQPRAGDLGRRAGLDRGAAAEPVRLSASTPRASSTSSCCSSPCWRSWRR